jgi:hypothetical protein
MSQYADDGQPIQTVCAFVTRDAACKCSGFGATCKGVGTCSYFMM